MSSEKKGNLSQDVKPGPEEMRSKARGKLSKAAFTNGEAGPFSKGYLSGESIYERLQEGETAHYILVNKSEGIIIHPTDGGDSESLTSGSGYRSVMTVTNRRILFVLGGDEDAIVEINSADLTEANFQTSPWQKHVTVVTESNQYEFGVSIQESSDHEDSVRYIQKELVPNTSNMDHSSGSATSEPDRSDLIEELHRLDEDFDGEIGVSHVRKRSRYPVSAYLQEFGSWRETFKSAIQEESNQGPQDDSGVDSNSKNNGVTSDQESHTQTEAEPTQEDVITAIERVSAQLGKRPTTSEFSTHSSLDLNDAYRHFDSWGDALDAASLDTLTRQDLLEELQRLSTELGFPPLSSHVDEHSQFSTYDYRQVFGSVNEAVNEAGLSVEGQVRDTLRELTIENDDDPKVSDFEAASDYSAGVIYKFFDGWDDALSEVSSTDEFPKKGDKHQSVETIAHNELSEWYELVRYLQELCTTVLDVRQNQLDDEDADSPMEKWADKVTEFWKGEATQTEGYGTQHAERNSFSMQEYRENFGDGDWVTEFECVRVRQPSPTMQALFRAVLDDGPDDIYLPVDEQTGDAFPVIVDTERKLSRAVEMLDRLPAKPASVDPDTDAGPGFEWTGGNIPDATTDSGELQDVNGVTDAIERSLLESGLHTRSDLKKASLDELTDIDGISDQVAMRIKVDVGG